MIANLLLKLLLLVKTISVVPIHICIYCYLYRFNENERNHYMFLQDKDFWLRLRLYFTQANTLRAKKVILSQYILPDWITNQINIVNMY